MIKPKIKINFLYYGNPFDIKKNSLFKILMEKYDVVISNKPDYVFFSVYKENNKFLLEDGTFPNYEESHTPKKFLKEIYINLLKIDFFKGIMWFLRDKKIIKPFARILNVRGDFIKIFYTCESIKPDMSKCDWAFALTPESELNHPRYMRIPHYIMMGNDLDLRKRKKPLIEIKKEKTKFCNFIYNNYVPPRNRFFKKLSKYKHVDSPGKCMNNMPPIGFHKNADKSRNFVDYDEEKIDFIKPYKFTIAFENTMKRGYNTDRLIHSLLANSIPIYWGDKTIYKDFNTKRFIDCKDFRNFDEVVKKVIELDKNDKLYEEILKQPWYNDNNQSKHIRKRIEKRFKEIFER